VRDEIFQSIRALIQSDATVPREQQQSILKACRDHAGQAKKRIGTVSQAAAILQCHPKTVYRYVSRGVLQPIRLSARKVRFDLDQVEAFASSGLPTIAEN
jgi:excisionase family DNA binding protein